MRVLVTGGTGFLGKHLQKELKKENIQYDLYPSKYDLRQEELVLSYFNDQWMKHGTVHYDAVIHLAAKVGGIVANSQDPFSFIYDNLRMGLNIIESCLTESIPKIVMVSTVCAYPENTPVPFLEEDLWNGYPEPTNAPYGVAKRTLTELLWASRKTLNSTVLNLANMYGPGDNEDEVKSHVIPSLIKKVKSGVAFEALGDGSSTRDFLYVKDAAKAIVLALKSPQGPQFGINVGTGVETSIKELLEKICKIYNFPLSNIKWTGELNGQKRRCLNCSKAQSLLGWTADTTLDEGLKKICR